MNRRIQFLKESPCYQCQCQILCKDKIKKIPKLEEYRDLVFPNADFDYHDCSIWIALNAPDMVEVEDE